MSDEVNKLTGRDLLAEGPSGLLEMLKARFCEAIKDVGRGRSDAYDAEQAHQKATARALALLDSIELVLAALPQGAEEGLKSYRVDDWAIHGNAGEYPELSARLKEHYRRGELAAAAKSLRDAEAAIARLSEPAKTDRPAKAPRGEKRARR